MDWASDGFLALVCLAILVLARRTAGLRWAAALIGAAAAAGTLSLAGLGPLEGPHRFLTLAAACGAFPLLAIGVVWPDSPLHGRPTGAGRFLTLAGGAGAVVSALALPVLAQGLALAAALAIAGGGAARRDGVLTGAGLLFLVGLAAAARARALDLWAGLGPGLAVGALHLCLAGALALLTYGHRRAARRAPVTNAPSEGNA